MKEIILTKDNIGSLQQEIQCSQEKEIHLFFPEYFYPAINEKECVPDYTDETVKKIEAAKKIAQNKGITVVINYKSYDHIIPESLNRDDFSDAALIYDKTYDDNPGISIIIPTCNRKDHLKKTIQALFDQDYQKNYEIIVVDDNSEDGTDLMIKGLASPVNLKHVYWPRKEPFVYATPTNRVGPVRNLGVKYARGDVLIFLDADIVANKDLIKEYMSCVDEQSVVIAPSIREHEQIDKRENYFNLCHDDIDKLSIKWTLLHSGNFCVLKENFEKVGGFDKDFVFYGKEDEELGYKFYRLGLEFKLNRKAYGVHLYHDPEYINETLKKVMHFYQVRIFYKKYLDKEIFYRFKHRMSPHLISTGTLCNNDCSFCHELQRKSFKNKTTDEIIEEIEISKKHGLDIILGGGEPAIREDFPEILDFCTKQGMIPEILTNGRVFRLDKYIQMLKSGKIARVMVYAFSSDKEKYDELTRSTNGLIESLRGIKNLIKHGFDVSANIIVTNENCDQINSMIGLMAKIGVKTIHISIIPNNLSKNELRNIANIVVKWQKTGHHIIFRDAFVECLSSEFNFNNQQLKEETCARCILKQDCPLESKGRAFVRIDDVEEKTAHLVRLLDLLMANNVPASLQVVPNNVTEECVDWILALKQQHPQLIEIGQHGWSHQNYDDTLQDNYEFGPKRSYEQQYEDIKNGKERMQELFGDHFDLIFTPPYHGYDKNTLKILEKLNFKKLYLGKEGLNGHFSFKVENHKIDPLYYENGKGYFKDLRQLKKEIVNNDVKLVLHPQYLDANLYNFLTRLFRKQEYMPNIIVTPGRKIGFDYVEKKKRYEMYLHNMKTYGAINFAPIEVEIELTFKCNLRCKMCDKWKLHHLQYGGNEREIQELFLHKEAVRDDDLSAWKEKYVGRKEILDLDTVKKLIDEFKEIGVRSVVLTGGEPSVHPDFNKIINYINESGLKGSILTNSVLLDDEVSRLLIEGDWKIRASVEGACSEINDSIMGGIAFDKIKENLSRLNFYKKKYQKGDLKIHSVIQKENIENIDNMVAFYEQQGFDFDFALPNGPIKEIFDEQAFSRLKEVLSNYSGNPKYKRVFSFIEDLENEEKMSSIIDMNPQKKHFEIEEIPCFYVANSCVINAYGDVYPCGSVINPSNMMGNISQNSFQDIWNGEKFNSFRLSTLPVNINKIPCCQECDMAEEFKCILSNLDHENMMLPKLKSLEIQLTNFCNLKCKVCDIWQFAHLNFHPSHIKTVEKIHVSEKIFERGSTLKEDKIELWKKEYTNRKEVWHIDLFESLITQLSKNGLKEITISGGEPLLHRDILKIVQIANKLGLKAILLTNGLLLTEKLSDLLMKGGWKVSLSLDGSNAKINDSIRGQGSFDLIIKALEMLKNSRMKYGSGGINLHFVVQEKNIQNILSFVEFGKKNNAFASVDLVVGDSRSFISEQGYYKLYGVLEKMANIKNISKHVPFIHKILDHSISKQDLIAGTPYKSIMKNKKCRLISEHCVINAFGDVYPCCNLMNPSNKMGNVIENDFEHIWAGQKYQNIRKKISEDNASIISCGECSIFYTY